MSMVSEHIADLHEQELAILRVKIERLDFALNALRLALKIDPVISNDDPALVAAMNAAVPGLLGKKRVEGYMADRDTRLIELWTAGGRAKEIAQELKVSKGTVNMSLMRLRKLHGEKIVPRRAAFAATNPPARVKSASWHLPDDQLKRIAFLWSIGRTEDQIEEEIGRHYGGTLVDRARRKLGLRAVPHRAFPAVPKKPGPLTMRDLDRHYLRRVDDEYIFRRGDNTEEVWVKTEAKDGILFHGKGTGNSGARLIFKNTLGATEKRA